MPYFGEIHIPWLTNKDTSVTRDLVEKGFVDGPPQVYELTSDFEAGTYSAVLNEDAHARSETLSEQRDAVLSMPSRHASEMPFEIGGDKGYLAVESSTASYTVNTSIDLAEMDVRFLDRESYKPGCRVSPAGLNQTNGYDVTPVESVFPLPATVENVKFEGSSVSPEYTILDDDVDIDFYLYDKEGIFTWEHPDADFTSPARRGIPDAFDWNDTKIYSSDKPLADNDSASEGYIDNGIVKLDFPNGTYEISQSGTNDSIGNSNCQSEGISYISEKTTDKTVFDSWWDYSGGSDSYIHDFEATVRRGMYSVEYHARNLSDSSNFSNYDEFWQDFFDSTDSVDFSNGWYAEISSDNKTFVIVKGSTDGDWKTENSGDRVLVDNLDIDKDYRFIVSRVPIDTLASDYARHLYNLGSWKRTMVQK